MITLLQKTSVTGMLALTTVLGSLTLLGCDKLPNNNHERTETTKVEIPKTAPLVAGESVSAALSRTVPTQDNAQNNKQADEQATSSNTQPTLNQQTNQPIATPAITPRNSSTIQNNKAQSIVTNQTQAGTPEFILKQALNTIYFGDAKQAGQYFQNNSPDLQQALEQTQPDFREAIENITFTKISYNTNKTQVKIDSILKFRGVEQPQPRAYTLQSTNGQWKILEQ